MKNILIIIPLIFVSNLSPAQIYPNFKSLVTEVDYYSKPKLNELFIKFNNRLSQTFDLEINKDFNRIENETDLENFLIELSSHESKIHSKLEDYGISVNMDIYLSDFYISCISSKQYSMVVEQSYFDSLDINIIQPFEFYRDNSGKVRISGIDISNCDNSSDLKEGFEIVKINSFPVKFLPNGLINRLVKTNTKIELQLKSDDNDLVNYEIDGKRSRVNAFDIKIYQNSIYLIKLNSLMNTGDTRKLISLLDQNEEKIEKVILDLRNFKGGLLKELISLADIFIKKNSEIVKISNVGWKIEKKTSIYSQKFKNIKVLILINNGTDSGANVIAGALKFNKVGTLIGEKTTMENSLRATRPLHDYNYFAQMVIGKFFFSKKESLYENGISPDIHIKDCVTSTKDDILEYALNYN